MTNPKEQALDSSLVEQVYVNLSKQVIPHVQDNHRRWIAEGIVRLAAIGPFEKEEQAAPLQQWIGTLAAYLNAEGVDPGLITVPQIQQVVSLINTTSLMRQGMLQLSQTSEPGSQIVAMGSSFPGVGDMVFEGDSFEVGRFEPNVDEPHETASPWQETDNLALVKSHEQISTDLQELLLKLFPEFHEERRIALAHETARTIVVGDPLDNLREHLIDCWHDVHDLGQAARTDWTMEEKFSQVYAALPELYKKRGQIWFEHTDAFFAQLEEEAKTANVEGDLQFFTMLRRINQLRCTTDNPFIENAMDFELDCLFELITEVQKERS